MTIVLKVSPVVQGEEAKTKCGSQRRAAPIRPARPAKPMVLAPTEKAPLVGLGEGAAVPELEACVAADAAAAAGVLVLPADGVLLGVGAAATVVPGAPATGVTLGEADTQLEFDPAKMLAVALYAIAPVLSLIAMEMASTGRSTSHVNVVVVCWGNVLRAAAVGWPPGIMLGKKGATPPSQEMAVGWH